MKTMIPNFKCIVSPKWLKLFLLFFLFCNRLNAQDNTIYTIVEKMPSFSGNVALYTISIANEIPCLIDKKIYFFKITIERDGSISDADLLNGDIKGSYANCKPSMVKAFNSMPKWNPGMQGGKVVRTYYNLKVQPDRSTAETRQTSVISTPAPSNNQSNTQESISEYNGKLNKPIDPQTGVILSRFDNGKVRSKRIDVKGTQTLAKIVNSQEKWITIDYYPNGQIKLKTEWQGNSKNGEQIECYENGNIKCRTYYTFNTPDREYITFYEGGNLKSKRRIINGKNEGESSCYYETGRLKSKEIYLHGLLEGEKCEYFENGNYSFKGIFKNDNRYGEWVWYREDGSIENKEIYDEFGDLKTKK